jgi:hypothetical protein
MAGKSSHDHLLTPECGDPAALYHGATGPGEELNE